MMIVNTHPFWRVCVEEKDGKTSQMAPRLHKKIRENPGGLNFVKLVVESDGG
jgi:hypothetical protein